MPTAHRCAGYTVDGKRCKKRITTGTHCSVHSVKSPQNKIKKIFTNHKNKQISAAKLAKQIRMLKQNMNRKASFPKRKN
jgi:hypothetical protein